MPEPIVEYDLNQNAFFIRGLVTRELSFTLNVNYTINLPPDQVPQVRRPQFEPMKGGWEIDTGEIRLRVQWQSIDNGVLITPGLTNVSGKNIVLHNISPATFDLTVIRDDLAGYRFYQHGFQSWSPCRPEAADTTQQYPRLKSFALMNANVDSPFWGRRDGLISHLFTVLNRPEQPALLTGFTGQRAGLGELFLRNRGLVQLIAFLDYGGKRLEPDEELEIEPLLVSAGNADELVAGYMDLLGENMQARVSESVPVGWCSWYELYTRVSEEKLLQNTNRLAQNPDLGVEFVQLDDGYQTAVGDWLSLNKTFPSGLQRLAAEIRKKGFKAGIWLAPFFATKNSELYRTKPDWFLKDAQGKPVDCGYNPSWNSRTAALDLSNPEVRNWLRHIFQQLVDWGFDYFKIDFLFAGLRKGQRTRDDLSPVEIYREALGLIRDTIGDQRFLLGCGAPVGPSVGLVDALRVSEDVKEVWHNRLWEWLGRGVGVPSAKGALRNNIQRHYAHNKLWLNDPDCLLVRERNTRLKQGERETLVTLLGMTGGMLFISDDLSRVGQRYFELLKAVLPPTTLTGRPVGGLKLEYPPVFALDGGARKVVAFTNWHDRAQKFDPADAINGEGNYLFDFWKRQPTDMSDFELAAHHTRVVQLTPRNKYPTVIGTDLHLTALCDGKISEEFDAKLAQLMIKAEKLANKNGRLWLAVPQPFTYLVATMSGKNIAIKSWGGGIVIPVDQGTPWKIVVKFIFGD